MTRLDDRDWDAILNITVRVALVAAICISGLLASCPNDDSITDCSSRGRPQVYDPQTGRYSCGDRQ
jgi:hypothetical protein